jgi:hypothetical protein
LRSAAPPRCQSNKRGEHNRQTPLSERHWGKQA